MHALPYDRWLDGSPRTGTWNVRRAQAHVLILISCPECSELSTILFHQIGDDGAAVVHCKCGFGGFVTLINWHWFREGRIHV